MKLIPCPPGRMLCVWPAHTEEDMLFGRMEECGRGAPSSAVSGVDHRFKKRRPHRGVVRPSNPCRFFGIGQPPHPARHPTLTSAKWSAASRPEVVGSRAIPSGMVQSAVGGWGPVVCHCHSLAFRRWSIPPPDCPSHCPHSVFPPAIPVPEISLLATPVLRYSRPRPGAASVAVILYLENVVVHWRGYPLDDRHHRRRTGDRADLPSNVPVEYANIQGARARPRGNEKVRVATATMFSMLKLVR